MSYFSTFEYNSMYNKTFIWKWKNMLLDEKSFKQGLRCQIVLINSSKIAYCSDFSLDSLSNSSNLANAQGSRVWKLPIYQMVWTDQLQFLDLIYLKLQ